MSKKNEFKYFKPELITKLFEFSIQADLAECRNALIAGLNKTFTSGIKKGNRDDAQLLLDLNACNEIEHLEDNSVPMKHWLQNAESLTRHRGENTIISEMLKYFPSNEIAQNIQETGTIKHKSLGQIYIQGSDLWDKYKYKELSWEHFLDIVRGTNCGAKAPKDILSESAAHRIIQKITHGNSKQKTTYRLFALVLFVVTVLFTFTSSVSTSEMKKSKYKVSNKHAMYLSIFGNVYDKTGSPIKGITLMIVGGGPEDICPSSVTDAIGGFSFSNCKTLSRLKNYQAVIKFPDGSSCEKYVDLMKPPMLTKIYINRSNQNCIIHSIQASAPELYPNQNM